MESNDGMVSLGDILAAALKAPVNGYFANHPRAGEVEDDGFITIYSTATLHLSENLS